MTTIDQILVTQDPLTPEREAFELTFDEVKEFGETFFSSGFAADVFLTDGSSYSFIKTNEGVWKSREFIADGLGKIKKYAGTFFDALNRLLDQANLKFSPS
jgi:hypothetical protein